MRLYVKVWCPWCVQAERWLRERSISYELLDVEAAPAAARRMREISGQTLTPTLELEDGSVLADFDTGQLEAFLREHDLL